MMPLRSPETGGIRFVKLDQTLRRYFDITDTAALRIWSRKPKSLAKSLRDVIR